MKTRIFILLTGAFIATAYLAGCGGGSNNSPAVAATCTQFAQGTPQYTACIANPTLYSNSNCGAVGTPGYGTPGYGQPGYAYGQPPYGQGTYQQPVPAGYPNQNYNSLCPATGVGGGYYGAGGAYPPPPGYGYQQFYYQQPVGYMPIQQPYYFNPNNRGNLNVGLSYSSWD